MLIKMVHKCVSLNECVDGWMFNTVTEPVLQTAVLHQIDSVTHDEETQ